MLWNSIESVKCFELTKFPVFERTIRQMSPYYKWYSLLCKLFLCYFDRIPIHVRHILIFEIQWSIFGNLDSSHSDYLGPLIFSHERRSNSSYVGLVFDLLLYYFVLFMFRFRLFWKILFFLILTFYAFMFILFVMITIAVLMRDTGVIREAILEVILIYLISIVILASVIISHGDCWWIIFIYLLRLIFRIDIDLWGGYDWL